MPESPTRPALETALAQLTEQTLSRGERAGHVALTLFAGAMCLELIAFITTQPNFPLRTMIAIWLLLAIASTWVAYGLHVLSRRRPLLANREVVAGRMALLFAALFTAGTMAVGWVNAGVFVTPNTWLGATMTAVAVANLARAMWRRSRLQRLRERLERELG